MRKFLAALLFFVPTMAAAQKPQVVTYNATTVDSISVGQTVTLEALLLNESGRKVKPVTINWRALTESLTVRKVSTYRASVTAKGCSGAIEVEWVRPAPIPAVRDTFHLAVKNCAPPPDTVAPPVLHADPPSVFGRVGDTVAVRVAAQPTVLLRAWGTDSMFLVLDRDSTTGTVRIALRNSGVDTLSIAYEGQWEQGTRVLVTVTGAPVPPPPDTTPTLALTPSATTALVGDSIEVRGPSGSVVRWTASPAGMVKDDPWVDDRLGRFVGLQAGTVTVFGEDTITKAKGSVLLTFSTAPPPPPPDTTPPPTGSTLLFTEFNGDPGCDTRPSGPLDFTGGWATFIFPRGWSGNERANGGVCVLGFTRSASAVTITFAFDFTSPFPQGVDGEEKIFLAQNDRGNNFYIEVQEPGGTGEWSGPVNISAFYMDDAGNQPRAPRVGSVSLASGQRHQVEWTIIAASRTGATDGQMIVKVNGTTVVNFRGNIASSPIGRIAPYPQFGNDGNPFHALSTEFRFRYDFVKVVENPTEPPPPPSGGGGNEPAGFTTVLAMDGSSATPADAWHVEQAPANQRPVTVADAALGQAVQQVTFPQGTAANEFVLWYGSLPSSMHELYMVVDLLVSNPWHQGSQGVTKVLGVSFLNAVTGGVGDVQLGLLSGGGANATGGMRAWMHAGSHYPDGRIIEPHEYRVPSLFSGETVVVGKWFKLEAHIVFSTSETVCDGRLKWWIDGRAIEDRPLCTPKGVQFTEWLNRGPWGLEGDVKRQTDYIRFANLRIKRR